MNAAKIPDDVEFIKIAEVRRITGLGTSTIYERMLAKEFPGQVKLGPKAVAWIKSEVQAWVKERISASRPG
ncbi:AlpA family phage regulatory protein [Pseudomonas sp. P66]|uniref:AlpA family phage regulatory protein n=1 Tax=Pseudomonas arcuscaelestis TaxID=2710591 RepID=A0ABS2C300_9PSED|nr:MULTISPECIES: AlpA family phage regulatory protein [Pseudomonas]MBM5460247.1 AlpA family phage regulatory protein [Pseudomonas arcuscaelestis]